MISDPPASHFQHVGRMEPWTLLRVATPSTRAVPQLISKFSFSRRKCPSLARYRYVPGVAVLEDDLSDSRIIDFKSALVRCRTFTGRRPSAPRLAILMRQIG